LDFFNATLLGVIQGLTEFLPVSSSAHLILARAVFGWDLDRFGLPFDVACHVGTLLALIVYFRREVTAMLVWLPGALAGGTQPAARLLRLIIVGTIPAVLVGLVFNRYIEGHLRTPLVAALALALGAIALLVAERAAVHRRAENAITMGDALLIGMAQAIALIPGVSRSGATLAMALLLGVRRAGAARFVFLLGIPAILAAAAHEGLVLRHEPLGRNELQIFAVGVVVSAIVGYLTVKFFIQYLSDHSLDVFAWYRLALAGVVGVWLLR
jgi:undecaprenyl-diphosphatase